MKVSLCSILAFAIALISFPASSLTLATNTVSVSNGVPEPAPPPPPVNHDETAGQNVSAPVAQVLKLTEARVPEEVVMSYIENSPQPFNLTTENIIYLQQQAGLAPKAVAAMMHRDRELRESASPSNDNGGPPQSPYTQPPNTVPPTYPPPPAPNSYIQPPQSPPPAQPEEMTNNYPPNDNGYDNGEDQAAGAFYNSLAPYGQWSNQPGYGWCWQPNEACQNPNWAPYCNQGQWFFTDCGWYWNSYYPWGWCPFHYGCWWRSPQCGWLWKPGSTWGPSWVTWRDCGNNIGWAPLPPGCQFDGKSGLCCNNQPVSSSFGFGLKSSDFSFVPAKNFAATSLNLVRLTPEQANKIFSNTRVINGICPGPRGSVCNLGLDVNLVAGDSQDPIIRARVQDSSSPFNSGFFPSGSSQPSTVSVFRPHVNAANLNAQPASLESLAIQPLPPNSQLFRFNTRGANIFPQKNIIIPADPKLNVQPSTQDSQSIQPLPPDSQLFRFNTRGANVFPQKNIIIPADPNLNVQPSTRESLAIPPFPQTANQNQNQNQGTGAGQSFTFNKGFLNIIPPAGQTGPPFAPAGFGRTQFVRGKGNGKGNLPGVGVVPHASSGRSAGGGGRHG